MWTFLCELRDLTVVIQTVNVFGVAQYSVDWCREQVLESSWKLGRV